MKKYRIENCGCDDTVCFNIELTVEELKEMLDKHEKILKDNNWIQAIIVLSLFGKNMTIEELDAMLTKLENGTLTKEDILRKEKINDIIRKD